MGVILIQPIPRPVGFLRHVAQVRNRCYGFDNCTNISKALRTPRSRLVFMLLSAIATIPLTDTLKKVHIY